jgi:branched-chain amino acid transport system ATP-binding protein
MMLELRAVDGFYGQIQAVRQVSLTLEPGSSVALLGRNGAGKSTLLKLIAGVLRPARGEVVWKGEVINDLGPEQRIRKGIVLVPEGRGVFPGLTVDDNIRVGAFWHRPRKKELERRLAETYKLLPALANRREQRAGTLSGGEQQLLAIGRGLMGRPELLLLDEPSLGLAPLVVQSLYELLGQLVERGIAIVLVEQFVPLASQLCGVVAGINKGRLVFHGEASSFASDPALLDTYMGTSFVAPDAWAGSEGLVTVGADGALRTGWKQADRNGHKGES